MHAQAVVQEHTLSQLARLLAPYAVVAHTRRHLVALPLRAACHVLWEPILPRWDLLGACHVPQARIPHQDLLHAPWYQVDTTIVRLRKHLLLAPQEHIQVQVARHAQMCLLDTIIAGRHNHRITSAVQVRTQLAAPFPAPIFLLATTTVQLHNHHISHVLRGRTLLAVQPHAPMCLLGTTIRTPWSSQLHTIHAVLDLFLNLEHRIAQLVALVRILLMPCHLCAPRALLVRTPPPKVHPYRPPVFLALRELFLLHLGLQHA